MPTGWKDSNAGLRPHVGRKWLAALIALLCLNGCSANGPAIVAVIPRTTGTGLWEPEHAGAEVAAVRCGIHLYWNAPNREDDVEGQIAMVRQVIDRHYRGLVLAPDQVLALMTPVRQALADGIPTVIVGSPLSIPPEGKYSSILNDEVAGGRMAAMRVAGLLHGRGTIAVLGINPDIAGIVTRARSFELFLAQNYPDIHVVKRMGSFNLLHEQQIAGETLRQNPNIDVFVGLMWSSTRAAISTAENAARTRTIRVVGFDPEGVLLFNSKQLDSVILPNMRDMGQQAIELVEAERHGHRMPPLIVLPPILVTRADLDTDEVRRLTSMDWRPGGWDRSVGP